jgi:hypothetical protein
MTEKVDWYACLRDALFRFACGPWPPIGQEFKWRTRAEIEQALKWITWLEREQEREEEEIRAERYYRRKAKEERRKVKAPSVVKLIPPHHDDPTHH